MCPLKTSRQVALVQVACSQRGRNASQLNIGGTGLGSFNDRFRDSLMGGSPFASPRYQGYVTGLHTQPNSFTQVSTGSSCFVWFCGQCYSFASNYLNGLAPVLTDLRLMVLWRRS